jgi:hypothetical protein
MSGVSCIWSGRTSLLGVPQPAELLDDGGLAVMSAAFRGSVAAPGGVGYADGAQGRGEFTARIEPTTYSLRVPVRVVLARPSKYVQQAQAVSGAPGGQARIPAYGIRTRPPLRRSRYRS